MSTTSGNTSTATPISARDELKALTVRFPPAMYRDLVRVAADDEHNLAQVVRKAVRQYLARGESLEHTR